MKRIKINLLSIFMIVFCLSSINAQKIEWGNLEKSSRNYFPHIIGEDENDFFIFGQLKSDYIIERYDKANKSQKMKVIIEEEKIDGNKTFIESVTYMKGRFVVLISYFDKKSKTSKLIAYGIDSKDGKRIKGEVEVFNLAIEKKKSYNFSTLVTGDMSKLVVMHKGYNNKQKKTRVNYKLLNADFETLTSREDVFMAGDKSLGKASYGKRKIVDNDGSLYFLSGNQMTVYDANNNYEKWEEIIDYEKLGLDIGSRIANLDFKKKKKNDLIITGYYSKEKNNFDGCFFLKVDGSSKEIVVTKINEFDQEFKNQFRNSRQEKKDKVIDVKKLFNDITIHNTLDDGIVLIGETHLEHHTDKSGRSLYLDLAVFKFSSSGNLEWAHRVPKKQKYSYNVTAAGNISPGGGFARIYEYFSFVSTVTSDKLYIMFNDHPKNTTDADKEKTIRDLSKSVINMFSIDLKSGDKNEKLFYGAKTDDVYLNTLTSFQQNEKTNLITFARKSSKYKFGIFQAK